jgi:hypothetical protein
MTGGSPIMKRLTMNIRNKAASFIAVAVLAVTGISVFGTGQSASATGGGFYVVNNCGSQRTFGYNHHDSAPGTGAYYQVAAGSTYTVASGEGIWRVELPRGVMNTFVYNDGWNTLNMC